MDKMDALQKDIQGATPEENLRALKDEVNVVEDYVTVHQFPAGYYDKESKTTIKEFEIREMDGADEEAMQTNKKVSNEGRNINKLLERCIVRIGHMTPKNLGADEWKKIIRGLCTPDQDYAVLMIRKISFGSDLTVGHVCPECSNRIKTQFTIDELEVIEYSGDATQKEMFELPRGIKDSKGKVHREGYLRLPTGADREILTPVAKANMAKGKTLMLTRLVTFDDGYPISDSDIRGMSMRDRKHLTDINEKMLGFGIQLRGKVECPACGNEFTGGFSSVDFQ